MKTNDTIFLNNQTNMHIPPIEESSVKGYIKHVVCNGARFHIIHYDMYGCHCSEKNCIINYRGDQK